MKIPRSQGNYELFIVEGRGNRGLWCAICAIIRGVEWQILYVNIFFSPNEFNDALGGVAPRNMQYSL